MDAKLKEKLAEAIEKAYERRAAIQKRYSSRTKIGTTNAPFPVQKLHHLIYAEARRLLVRERSWRKIEKALAQESIERMSGDFLRRQNRSAEDPAQLRLPGFENLPLRVRIKVGDGRQSVVLARMTVAQFLGYKDNYLQRNARNLGVVDELKRLAETVEKFKAEPDITVAEAFDRANVAAGRPRLAVVSPVR